MCMHDVPKHPCRLCSHTYAHWNAANCGYYEAGMNEKNIYDEWERERYLN